MRRLVIEADGGSRGNPGPAAYGAVVLDGVTGEVLVELADAIGIATNNVAEYEGLLAGLRAATQVDPEARIEARLDSKLVVEQMRGGWAIRNSRLKELALQARALAPVDRVTYQWVPRARNARADALANRALDAQAARKPARIEVWHAGGPDATGDEADLWVDAAQAKAAVDEGEPEPLGSRGWPPADMGTPSSLILVRHGVTAQSLEHRFSGFGGADPDLIDVGREQAGAAAEELLRRGGADVVVCSPMNRARQTAEIIAERLGLPKPVGIPGLAESRFGEWDSMTFAEVGKLWPAELERWLGSTDYPPPGGESFEQVRHRADAARVALLEQFPEQRIVAVSHVTPIKALVQVVLGAPPASTFRVALPPCSLSTMSWWQDGISVAHGIGEVGHLHGLIHEWV